MWRGLLRTVSITLCNIQNFDFFPEFTMKLNTIFTMRSFHNFGGFLIKTSPVLGRVSKADISNIWVLRVAPHRCWATISLKLTAKIFVHCVQKLGPQPTRSHLKLGTAVATEYHKHVPNVPATALHFSETKENLLQLSITALFIQPKKIGAKANGNFTDLSYRKAISLLILQGFFTLPCLAPC